MLAEEIEEEKLVMDMYGKKTAATKKDGEQLPPQQLHHLLQKK